MSITERLLHFIWQFQYFNKNELTTSEGEFVQVIMPGQYNNHQGPDFSNAKILIGSTTWREQLNYISKRLIGKNTNITKTKIMTMSFSMLFGRMMEAVIQ